MNMEMLSVNWMEQGNLTNIILNDTLNRLSNITGARRLYVEKTYWQTISMLEKRYDIELYLTGQVFAGPHADREVLESSKEFWEDLVQDSVRLTQHTLEQ